MTDKRHVLYINANRVFCESHDQSFRACLRISGAKKWTVEIQ